MAEINLTPTIKQDIAWQYLIDDKTKFIGFGGGAGSGKSFWGVTWLIVMCYMYPGYRGFIARNELKRLMNSTFVTFKKACTYYKIPSDEWTLDGKYNVIKFNNGSTIDLLDVAFKPTDADYERFGSLEYTGGFGEELGEWPFDAFDILKSRIGRHNIFTIDGKEVELAPKFFGGFNPSRNWVYRVFYMPWSKGQLAPDYAFIPALYKDNPYTAKTYGENLASITNEVNRARLMEGDWEYEDDANALVRFDHLQDMFTNFIKKEDEKYLIIDVARKGADATVFSFWQGLECYRVEKYHKQGTDKTIQQAKDFSASEQIPMSQVLVDEDGIGGGVVDGLPGVKGFTANSTPIPTATQIRSRHRQIQNEFTPKSNFKNLKAQCAFKIAELITDHKVAVTATNIRDELMEELPALLKEKDFDKESKIQLIPKEEVKEALGHSPDLGDTFIMRAWFELFKDQRPGDTSKAGHMQNVQFDRNIYRSGMNSAR